MRVDALSSVPGAKTNLPGLLHFHRGGQTVNPQWLRSWNDRGYAALTLNWGGVYNGEMRRLMLRHAFRFVGKVVFLIGPQNWRSRRAVEKIGGVLAGTRTDGAGRESVVYQILASQSDIVVG